MVNNDQNLDKKRKKGTNHFFGLTNPIVVVQCIKSISLFVREKGEFDESNPYTR